MCETGLVERKSSRVFYGPSNPPPRCPMQSMRSESRSALRRESLCLRLGQGVKQSSSVDIRM